MVQLAAHPISLQHVVHLRSPQLVVQEISPLKHLQHVGRQISRKRNLQLAEVLVVQGTNKKDIPCGSPRQSKAGGSF